MQKLTTTYHFFTDNFDDWFDTLEEAEEAYQETIKDNPYARARIYLDISEVDGDLVEEEYLIGQGEFPY